MNIRKFFCFVFCFCLFSLGRFWNPLHRPGGLGFRDLPTSASAFTSQVLALKACAAWILFKTFPNLATAGKRLLALKGGICELFPLFTYLKVIVHSHQEGKPSERESSCSQWEGTAKKCSLVGS